jgi:hypothetical protein
LLFSLNWHWESSFEQNSPKCSWGLLRALIVAGISSASPFASLSAGDSPAGNLPAAAWASQMSILLTVYFGSISLKKVAVINLAILVSNDDLDVC